MGESLRERQEEMRQRLGSPCQARAKEAEATARATPTKGLEARYYRVSELAQLWHVSRDSVRRLVMDDPGVMKMRNGRKKANTVYIIPESVALRLSTRLLNGDI